MTPLFGPAGNSEDFAQKGYKSYKDIPLYILDMGLDLYEYQCGRGVKISLDSARELGELASSAGIELSVHAPYFISLSGTEEEKRLKSIDYILDTARAAKEMGGQRIVVHSGSCSKISREEALVLAKDTLSRARQALIDNDLSDIIICPETMGKINQLGTLEEVIELTKVSETFIPCVDFGHLNSRDLGVVDYKKIFEALENGIGYDKTRIIHSHFSKIEYSKMGEVKHLTFEDTMFGPDYEELLELCYKKNYAPHFICESAGTQSIDALSMKNYYRSIEK